jgi:hypothetical protein
MLFRCLFRGLHATIAFITRKIKETPKMLTAWEVHMVIGFETCSADLNWETQHVSYWLVPYQRPRLSRQDIPNLL